MRACTFDHFFLFFVVEELKDIIYFSTIQTIKMLPGTLSMS